MNLRKFGHTRSHGWNLMAANKRGMAREVTHVGSFPAAPELRAFWGDSLTKPPFELTNWRFGRYNLPRITFSFAASGVGTNRTQYNAK